MESSCGFLDSGSGGRFWCCLPCLYLAILGDDRWMCFLLSCKKLPLILEKWIDSYLPECGLLLAQTAKLFSEGYS